MKEQKTIYLDSKLFSQSKQVMKYRGIDSFNQLAVKAIKLYVAIARDEYFRRHPEMRRFEELERQKTEDEDEFGIVPKDDLRSDYEWEIWTEFTGKQRPKVKKRTDPTLESIEEVLSK